MQWSRNMVHSHFTLCLRAQDYITWLSQHPWYGLWMRVKGPHHYKVTALGSRVRVALRPTYLKTLEHLHYHFIIYVCVKEISTVENEVTLSENM